MNTKSKVQSPKSRLQALGGISADARNAAFTPLQRPDFRAACLILRRKAKRMVKRAEGRAPKTLPGRAHLRRPTLFPTLDLGLWTVDCGLKTLDSLN